MVRVGLRDFFDLTQKLLLVGLVIQPNPKIFTTQPNPPFSGWIVKLSKKFFLFKSFIYPQFIIIRMQS